MLFQAGVSGEERQREALELCSDAAETNLWVTDLQVQQRSFLCLQLLLGFQDFQTGSPASCKRGEHTDQANRQKGQQNGGKEPLTNIRFILDGFVLNVQAIVQRHGADLEEEKKL